MSTTNFDSKECQARSLDKWHVQSPDRLGANGNLKRRLRLRHMDRLICCASYTLGKCSMKFIQHGSSARGTRRVNLRGAVSRCLAPLFCYFVDSFGPNLGPRARGVIYFRTKLAPFTRQRFLRVRKGTESQVLLHFCILVHESRPLIVDISDIYDAFARRHHGR